MTAKILLRHRQPSFLAATLVLIVFAASFAPRPASAARFSPQAAKTSVIFAISGEGDEYQMDAVVMVSGKRLTTPFTDEQKDRQKSFAQKYFASGRKYRLIFGGGDAGTVTVKQSSEGCNSIHSQVSVATSARLGGQVKALATSSEQLGKRASSRRAPSEEERAAVLKLVNNIYTQRRTPAKLLASIKVTNLTATDLDGDGKPEMVGSFMLTATNKFERDLFLIAKINGPTARADFVKFQAYQPPPEEFLFSIDFIDQLDVDGDGQAEVFAVQGGFDGYGYLIFRKIAGRWRQVYDSIGDAC